MIMSRDEDEEEASVEGAIMQIDDCSFTNCLVDDFGVDEGGWEKVSSHRNRHGSRACNRRPNDQSQNSKKS